MCDYSILAAGKRTQHRYVTCVMCTLDFLLYSPARELHYGAQLGAALFFFPPRPVTGSVTGHHAHSQVSRRHSSTAPIARAGAVHDIYAILQGLMESVALAIKAGTVVQYDDGAYIDTFRIPAWFYDEVMKKQ
jgi:hypothetical protein